MKRSRRRIKKSILLSWTASMPFHHPKLKSKDIQEAQVIDTCHITTLATELIQHIIDCVPPESHLDFARTCKQLYACSSDVLKRHRDAHIKYGVSADLDPTIIPTLLRSAFGYGDPVLAYHVQSLELWYDRTSWLHWKTLDFQTPIEQDTEALPVSWKYVYGEVDTYLSCLEHGPGAVQNLCAARTQLMNGCDGFLKAVLLVHCPRLQLLKCVMSADNQLSSVLSWLRIIIDHAYNERIPWPPGLKNLSNVAVGLPSETWMDSPYDAQHNGPNSSMLMQLLRLPRIEKLYFKDYIHDHDHDDSVPYQKLLPEGSSSVKHIFLDNPDELGFQFTEAFAHAPCALLSASFRAGPATLENCDTLVRLLGRYQGNSLQSLMFYGYSNSYRRHRGIHGYRCNAFRPEELEHYNVLKHLCINIQDIELQAFYDEQHCREAWESDGAWLERCFVGYFEGGSLEALVLWNGLTQNHISWEPSEEQGFEDAVCWLMNGSEPDVAEGTLKALYLEDVERQSGPIPGRRGRAALEGKDHVWWRRAMEVGRKRGVDVHTLTNRYPPRHQHEFPEAPDKYSWVNGPWGERPGDWVFDVYSGRRGPRGCGKCGNCEVCFALYPKELWDGIVKEPRRVKISGKDAEVGEIKIRDG
jgi:hypothetical protein